MPATTPDPDLLSNLIVPGIVSLVVALTVAIAGWLWNARQQRRARDAELFASAYAAVQTYKEFPYVIHRRNPDRESEERVRISEQLREVQRDIAFHTAWLRIRNKQVSKAYDHLVTQTQRAAGGLMRERWTRPGASTDAEMNVPGVHEQLAALEPAEAAYLNAVKQSLAWHRP